MRDYQFDDEIFVIIFYGVMHLQKALTQLGHTSNEARVYLAALNLGESTLTDIARKAKLPRTSCYSILEKLRERGLMNYYVKRKKRFWLSENPEQLLIALREQAAALETVMPELQGLRYETGVKPTVRFYDGIEGIKLILADIIREKRHILALTSIEDAIKLLGEEFGEFIEQRYTRHLRVRFITNRSPQTLEMKKRDSEELRFTKFLPEDIAIRNANFIYGDKVAILSLSKKHPVGIIIEDADISHTHRILFEGLWDKCSS